VEARPPSSPSPPLFLPSKKQVFFFFLIRKSSVPAKGRVIGKIRFLPPFPFPLLNSRIPGPNSRFSFRETGKMFLPGFLFSPFPFSALCVMTLLYGRTFPTVSVKPEEPPKVAFPPTFLSSFWSFTSPFPTVLVLFKNNSSPIA